MDKLRNLSKKREGAYRFIARIKKFNNRCRFEMNLNSTEGFLLASFISKKNSANFGGVFL